MNASRAGKRALSGAVVLMVVALAGTALAQDPNAASEETLRVTWQPRAFGVVPTLEGQVQNDSRFWVSAVRLRVEGFDEGGEPVGERSAWTFGNIAPGGRGYFVVPSLPRAKTYRITVSGFDRVSGGIPRAPESP